jgi:tetratricopeptide (TPR) repeat protein
MKRALVLLATFIVLLGAGRALGALDEAVKRNNFGAELLRQGRVDEAIAEFQRAIAVDPSYASPEFNLAYAYERGERIDEAIAQYGKALQIDPRNVLGHNNLGVLYDKKGQYDDAIREYEEALRIDPSNATVLANLERAKKGKGIVQEREARIAEARRQVEARPKDPSAAYNLGRLYASLDMRGEAFEWLTKAIELGFDDLRFLQEDPALAVIRTDPRFNTLLQGH